MFWNDIKEIKEWMGRLTSRLVRIDDTTNELSRIVVNENELRFMINAIVIDAVRETNLDKIEDCMKNVDKLNQMINEFKGLVAIVRAERNAKEGS